MSAPERPADGRRDLAWVQQMREASDTLPKPLVEIGGKPIQWHIIELHGLHRCRRLILCLGYKCEFIKLYSLDNRAEVSDFTLHMAEGHLQEFHNFYAEEDCRIRSSSHLGGVS